VRFKQDGAVTNVGGGYTDKMRTQFMANGPDSYVGRIMEVKGQEMTPDGLVRFPVFVRWRDQADVSP
jgi:ATP-dependent DNA ligase